MGPGDERSADVIRTLGAPMIADILLRLNIDITHLGADSRIRIVQEVALGLSEGQAPDTVTRRLRDVGLDRGRLFTIVNTHGVGTDQRISGDLQDEWNR